LAFHLATLYRTGFVAKALPKRATGESKRPTGSQGEGASVARNFTDRYLKSLRPTGKHYDKWDLDGFGVRVSDKGTKTFVLMARYPGSNNPTRRAIGHYPAVSLAKARQTAAQWREWIAKGKDPADEINRQRAAEERKRANSFRAVAEDFINLAAAKQRKGAEVKRDIEREFIARWDGLPITGITTRDVTAVLDEVVARGATYQAHNLLGHIRRLFNWAIARGVYGVDHSPCDRMKPKDVIGAKAARTRVFNDSEWRAFWRATERIKYPYGPLFRMLALTGQRKSEVAEAQWSEFDLARKLWTIPAERMKADAPHVVPLSDAVIAILESLPRFNKGDHLFSTDFGQKPVNGFSKAKIILDKAILAELRKENHKPKLAPFVIHDIRRGMRTGLSALPVPSDVAELVIAHSRPGLRRVYDQYAFEAEKRRALELWAARLRDIVEPPPANVIELGARQ
jgi:integrase